MISIQVDPPLGANYAGLLEVAAAVRDSGLGAYVDVNDNATARVGMNPLIVVGGDRADGRDRDDPAPDPARHDRSWGSSRSCSARTPRASGTSSPSPATRPRSATTPARAASTRSTRSGSRHLISRLNHGENYNGKAIDAPTSFFVGVAVNPTADDLDLELDRFRRKVEAGAQFAMTQIVFDLDHLEPFLDRIGGTPPIPLILGVFPLTSYRLALRLHNEVPGIVVPEALQDELRDAGSREAEVGFAHARELLAAARDRAAGVYVVAPYRKPLSVLELLG